MIYEILIAAIVLMAILFVIYLFYVPKKEGIPKDPVKKSMAREDGSSSPHYTEGEVIVDDELYGMKMIWDSYEDRVENFIKFLQNSKNVHDPKVITTFQDIEGDYVKMKKRLHPFLREHMIKTMDERILYAKDLMNKKFRY